MESRLIHNILDSVPGVLSVDVMVVTKMVSVHHEPTAISPAALVAALNSAGLQASLNRHSTSGGSEPAAAAKSGMCSSGCCGAGPQAHGSWQQQQPQQQRRGLSWLLAALRGNPALPPVCVLLSALLLLVNLLLLLPGVGAPHILQKGLLALIAAAVAVPPVLVKAWNGLRNKNLDMNSLVSIHSVCWAAVPGWACLFYSSWGHRVLTSLTARRQAAACWRVWQHVASSLHASPPSTCTFVSLSSHCACMHACCPAGGGGPGWCHRPG